MWLDILQWQRATPPSRIVQSQISFIPTSADALGLPGHPHVQRMGRWSHCPAWGGRCSAFYLTSCSTSRTAAMRQDGFLEGLAAQVGHGREPRAEVWKQQALGEPCGRHWRTATCSYLLLLSTDVYSGAGWESITWDWDLWKGGAGQAKRTSYVNRRARTVRSQFP